MNEHCCTIIKDGEGKGNGAASCFRSFAGFLCGHRRGLMWLLCSFARGFGFAVRCEGWVWSCTVYLVVSMFFLRMVLVWCWVLARLDSE